MKCFFIYFIMTISTFAQISLPRALLDTIPPFEIGNMWLFDMHDWHNNGSRSYEITKEIVGTDSANNFVVRVKEYDNNQIINDTTEYWIWQDSSYSESSSVFYTEGSILYKIGLENYFINGGYYTEEYTNITDTIFSIITEGSIFDYYVEYTPSYTLGYRTQFGLKVGLYEYRFRMTGEGGWFVYTDGELAGIKINGIIYGDSTHLITGVTDPIEVTSSFDLFQNYPNPFNPITTINYSVPKPSYVTIKVYNALGKEIMILVDEDKSIGNYSINFNATYLSSGIYFYQMKTAEFIETKKMLLLK